MMISSGVDELPRVPIQVLVKGYISWEMILYARRLSQQREWISYWCPVSVGRSAAEPRQRVRLVETARALVEGGASVDTNNSIGERPLHLTVKVANLELLSFLLAHGADPDATTSIDSYTPLHEACIQSDMPLNIIKRLAVACHIEACDGTGMTPLHWSCYTGRKEVVAHLLDLNADIESRGGSIDAPSIHHAARGNNNVLLRYLIQKGSDLTSVKPSDEIAIHQASRSSALDTLRVLVAKEILLSMLQTQTWIHHHTL
jgi:ankyrin repeat protein